MLMRTLKMAFWVTYDHLGKLIVVNMLSVLLLMAPGGLAYAAIMSGDVHIALVVGCPMLVVTFGILLPLLAAAMAHMVKELIDTKDGSVRTFFSGLHCYAWRAVRVGLAYVLAVCCLVTSTWFYANRLGDSLPWLAYALSALALWALIFFALTALLVMPALVQKREGVWATFKLSALLVLDNPVFCFGLAMYWVLLASLALLPPVLFLFSLGPQIVLESSAYEILSRKYAAVEAGAVLAHGFPWRKAKGTIDWKDEEDDYLNRGFRDFLFPWKG